MHLDQLIIDRFFQPIADFVMNRWEKSCYWLSGQSALACGVFSIVSDVNIMIADQSWSIRALMFFVLVMWLLLLTAQYMAAQIADRAASRGQLAFPTSQSPFRLVWIFVCLLDVFSLIRSPDAIRVSRLLGNISYLAVIYFAACLPRPPMRKQTERKSIFEFAS